MTKNYLDSTVFDIYHFFLMLKNFSFTYQQIFEKWKENFPFCVKHAKLQDGTCVRPNSNQNETWILHQHSDIRLSLLM
jgi:hypothetical protein